MKNIYIYISCSILALVDNTGFGMTVIVGGEAAKTGPGLSPPAVERPTQNVAVGERALALAGPPPTGFRRDRTCCTRPTAAWGTYGGPVAVFD